MNINTSMQSHRTVMDTAPIGPFRIFRESAPEPLPINIDRHLDKASMLAARELLRSLPTRKGHRELEPFSREWFEEIETKRYAPHGGWLRRVLEFTRHARRIDCHASARASAPMPYNINATAATSLFARCPTTSPN